MTNQRKNNAVIFHIGRCGSTVLCHLLNQHTLVECRGEIFNPFMKKKQQGEEIPQAEEILNEVVRLKHKANQVIEIKFLECQHPGILNLSLSKLILLLEKSGFDHFIILERKNYLRRMISHCVAQQTQVFHLRGNLKADLHPIILNTDKIAIGTGEQSLLQWFEIFKKAYDNLKTLLDESKSLGIFYEDDIQFDPVIAYSKICTFMDLETEPVSIGMNKTNPFSIKEILINYNEVEEKLIDTVYEWMLEKGV